VQIWEEWHQYLIDNNLQPADLLNDHVHPNLPGNQLMAWLVARHLQFNPVLPCGWMDRVRMYEAKRFIDEGADDEITFTGAPWRRGDGSSVYDRAGACVVGESPDSALRLVFTGTRVDIAAGIMKGELGTAGILIDGKKPSDNPRLYTFTRPTKAAPDSWWPGIRRIGNEKPLVVEKWTLRVKEISDDCSAFTYEVIGSKTGHDGVGNNRERFVSNSGRIVIEPRDLVIQDSYRVLKSKCPPGFEIHWEVVPMFVDIYSPPVAEKDDWHKYANRIHLTTVANGLEDGVHVLEVIPVGDGPVPIEEIYVHRPPLH